MQIRRMSDCEIPPEYIIEVTTPAGLGDGPAFGDLYNSSPVYQANRLRLQVSILAISLLLLLIAIFTKPSYPLPYTIEQRVSHLPCSGVAQGCAP